MGGDGGLVCGGVQITEQMEVVMSIAAYSACSGTMLIANKLTLHLIPAVRAPSGNSSICWERPRVSAIGFGAIAGDNCNPRAWHRAQRG